MEYVRLGKITKTFGLEGGVKCFSLTDFPTERFQPRTKLSLLDERTNQRKEVTLKSFRDSGPFYFLSFEGIDDISEAEKLQGFFVEIEKGKAPLPQGHYRLNDLLECEVKDEKGTLLGKVSEVLAYSTVKTLRVRRDGAKDFFVPFVDEFIKSVDIEKKTIVIHVIEGLL